MAKNQATTAKFVGKLESLAKISIFVTSAARAAGFDENTVYCIQLAADEAASNIVEHAYGEEINGDILCTCQDEPSQFVIILQDSGIPFDPNVVPDYGLDIPLENRRPGGAGLYIMRKLMDSVKFEFSPEAGNKLVMVKRK